MTKVDPQLQTLFKTIGLNFIFCIFHTTESESEITRIRLTKLFSSDFLKCLSKNREPPASVSVSVEVPQVPRSSTFAATAFSNNVLFHGFSNSNEK